MSLGAPLFLWAGLLGTAVVALYVLKVRRRRAPVPYLRLWAELASETRARSLFKRLRRLLSLLLQLLILVSMVLALTQPSFDLGALKKEHVVCLLDASASMQTVEADGRTRFEHLLERAEELVEQRSHEDHLLLALVSDRVEVLAPFTRRTIELRDALEGAAATNRSLDARRAHEFAMEVTRGKEHPVVLFLSDGASGEVAAAIKGDPNAHLVTVGEATENVGIVRFSARKNTSLATDYVLAVVRNFGEEPADVNLELLLDGVRQKVVPRTIPPGEELQEQWQLELPEGGTLQLTLGGERRDALAIDDIAYAVVRPDRLRRVVLVADDPARFPPFAVAFASMAEVIDETSMAVTVEEYDGLSDEERAADVTICLGALPAAFPTTGNVILMATPMPEGLPARVVGVDEAPRVFDWDRDHLLNRYLNYRDLELPPAVAIEVSRGDVLVEGYAGPLVAAFDQGEQRVVYVGFDMAGGRFPFRLAFPLLLRNAIAWFEIEEDVLLEDNYAPGDAIAPLQRVEGDVVTAHWFEAGAARSAELPVTAGRFWFDGTDEPGPYVFVAGGREHGTAVNLFDPAESEVAPAEEGGDPTGALEIGRHWLNRDVWTWLAMLALALWAAEWALYHRRITE